MAMTKCTECGHAVSTLAAACPNCGAPLATRPVAAAGSLSTNESDSPRAHAGRRAVYTLIGLGCVAALYLFAGSHPSAQPPNKPAPIEATGSQQRAASADLAPPTVIPTIAVNAIELQQPYAANTVAADEKYKGKRLLVSGLVRDINTDILGAAYLVFASYDEFTSPKATMASSERSTTAQLRRGQSVTLLCIGQGDALKSPMLDNCVFSAPSVATTQPVTSQKEAQGADFHDNLNSPSQSSHPPLQQANQVAPRQASNVETAAQSGEQPLSVRMEQDCSTGANSLRRAFERILSTAQADVRVARVVNVQNRKAYGCEVIFDMTDGNQVRGLFAINGQTINWTASESEVLPYEKLFVSRALALSPSDEGQ